MYLSDIVYCGILFPNMTFGNYGKRKLYRVTPYDKNLPDIYIPYQTDVRDPIYILFSFKEIDSVGKPIGIMTEKIGSIKDETNFYRYQLCCHQFVSKPFPKSLPIIENEKLKSRKCWNVFTIDPNTTKDYDDAFSIRKLSPNCFQISVYIANVPLLLESNKLWNLLHDRISTIYFPSFNIPLLPRILSEDCCSLQEGKERMVFYMDVIIVNDKIDTVHFDHCSVVVRKNYIYEEKKLLKTPDYKLLKTLTEKIFHCKNIDSHDVVSKWMVFMNHHCAKSLKTGILRCSEKKENVNPLFEYKGKYITTDETLTEHVPLHLDIYTHITSPIRRIVDILNMTFLQEELGLYSFSKETLQKCQEWLERLEYINERTNLIRKIQQQCQWVHLLKTNPHLQEEGIILEKHEKEDYQYQYLLYFPKLNMVKNVYTIDETKQVNEKYICQFHYFPTEISWQKKVRVEF